MVTSVVIRLNSKFILLIPLIVEKKKVIIWILCFVCCGLGIILFEVNVEKGMRIHESSDHLDSSFIGIGMKL